LSAVSAAGRPHLRAVLASPKMLAILVLGAASGFPNQITESALQAWLKDVHISNTTIGLMSYVSLPYLLKFLWAPLVDRYPLPLFGRRRGWMFAMQLALAVTIALLALQDPQVTPGAPTYRCRASVASPPPPRSSATAAPRGPPRLRPSWWPTISTGTSRCCCWQW
jgi:MFS family permease